jgi:hypothetical protein
MTSVKVSPKTFKRSQLSLLPMDSSTKPLLLIWLSMPSKIWLLLVFKLDMNLNNLREQAKLLNNNLNNNNNSRVKNKKLPKLKNPRKKNPKKT